jgi:hypothetical protein
MDWPRGMPRHDIRWCSLTTDSRTAGAGPQPTTPLVGWSTHCSSASATWRRTWPRQAHRPARDGPHQRCRCRAGRCRGRRRQRRTRCGGRQEAAATASVRMPRPTSWWVSPRRSTPARSCSCTVSRPDRMTCAHDCPCAANLPPTLWSGRPRPGAAPGAGDEVQTGTSRGTSRGTSSSCRNGGMGAQVDDPVELVEVVRSV